VGFGLLFLVPDRRVDPPSAGTATSASDHHLLEIEKGYIVAFWFLRLVIVLALRYYSPHRPWAGVLVLTWTLVRPLRLTTDACLYLCKAFIFSFEASQDPVEAF